MTDETIPEDIWKAANALAATWLDSVSERYRESAAEAFCLALLSERTRQRERDAQIAENHINPLGTRSWDADAIATAIRQP